MAVVERREDERPTRFTPRQTVRVEIPRQPDGHRATVRSTERRRTRVVVSRVGPWSVFKISLIFSFIGMLALLGGLAILYAVLGAMGVLADIEKLVNAVGVGHHFHFQGGWIFSHLFAIDLILVVVVSFMASVLTFLYNAVADLFGGIELTLESAERPAAKGSAGRQHVPASGNGHGTPQVMVWDRKPLRDAAGV
ncbi:MAG: DUF3566 domain-containing protein [Actinomycetota bacterium]|nr:DUF3566 domain-containing protein [Actinomycetota bacterium]